MRRCLLHQTTKLLFHARQRSSSCIRMKAKHSSSKMIITRNMTTTTAPMNIQRLAAFSDGPTTGGNPAGVVITDQLPSAEEMQRIAAEVGYSETAFAMPLLKKENNINNHNNNAAEEKVEENDTNNNNNNNLTKEEKTTSGEDTPVWRVRYFAPTSEVDFCGHATIALGAALAQQLGDGVFPLQLNKALISVEGKTTTTSTTAVEGGKGSSSSNNNNNRRSQFSAVLQSPPTYSHKADEDVITEALELFGYQRNQLDIRIPPAFANGGANHLLLFLNSRQAVSNMMYELEAGRTFMKQYDILTILIGYYDDEESSSQLLFHTRNAFASGGVWEDPATGAATAALAGYLRDTNIATTLLWPQQHHPHEEGEGGSTTTTIHVIQGEDMGSRSLLMAEIGTEIGSSIRVSGMVRTIIDDEEE